MKNLASQLVLAGVHGLQAPSLNKKAGKIFERFARTLEGKYFVGSNDRNETIRCRISQITYCGGIVSIAGVHIHASKINWFATKDGRAGAWIEGCGAII